jgi:hypothetical protein
VLQSNGDGVSEERLWCYRVSYREKEWWSLCYQRGTCALFANEASNTCEDIMVVTLQSNDSGVTEWVMVWKMMGCSTPSPFTTQKLSKKHKLVMIANNMLTVGNAGSRHV